MTITRMQEPRQLYGLGSLVKKITKPIKKVVKSVGKVAKSPIGLAALPIGDLTIFLIGLVIFLTKLPNPYNCRGSCIRVIVII